MAIIPLNKTMYCIHLIGYDDVGRERFNEEVDLPLQRIPTFIENIKSAIPSVVRVKVDVAL